MFTHFQHYAFYLQASPFLTMKSVCLILYKYLKVRAFPFCKVHHLQHLSRSWRLICALRLWTLSRSNLLCVLRVLHHRGAQLCSQACLGKHCVQTVSLKPPFTQWDKCLLYISLHGPSGVAMLVEGLWENIEHLITW